MIIWVLGVCKQDTWRRGRAWVSHRDPSDQAAFERAGSAAELESSLELRGGA